MIFLLIRSARSRAASSMSARNRHCAAQLDATSMTLSVPKPTRNDAAGEETGDERAERLETVIKDRDVAKVDATPHGQLSCCDLRHTTSCPLGSSGLCDQIPFTHSTGSTGLLP